MRISHFNDRQVNQMIVDSVRDLNILPVTSICDTSCIFCSHKNNPPDIDAINIGSLTLGQVESLYRYIDPRKMITIGESASPIIEGEPFVNKEIFKILKSIRKNFPQSPISLTTNGHYLTEESVSFLKNIGNIVLSVSVNSLDPSLRRILMKGDESRSMQTREGIVLLSKYGIPYFGGIVAMPNITGYDDISDTIRFLDKNNCISVKLFMPGYSKFADPGIFPDTDGLYDTLQAFIKNIETEITCPVLLEPSLPKDLTPSISAVARSSPAYNAGVHKGDVILSVNGRKPRSRVEAFDMIGMSNDIELVIQRNEQILNFKIIYSDEGIGLACDYDFDMSRADHIKELVDTANGKVLGLCSEYGHGILKNVLDAMDINEDEMDLFPVRNTTFGGSIKSSGLLTADDYIIAYRRYLRTNPKPAGILLPWESFSSIGLDLKGKSYKQLENALGVPIAFA